MWTFLKGPTLQIIWTDQAIELVRNKGDHPFFLNMWYYSVHTPIQAKKEKIKKYEGQGPGQWGLDKLEIFAAGDFFPCEHKKEQRNCAPPCAIRPQFMRP